MTEVKLSNGNTSLYEEYNGMFFETGMIFADGSNADYTGTVNQKLMETVSRCYAEHRRVRVWLGDTETGRAWNEEYDVTGYIGCSGGKVKVPLLINNTRSSYGMPILVHCLVRIDDIKTKKVLWKTDNFHVPEMTVRENPDKTTLYDWGVYQKREGEKLPANIANFKKKDQAERYIAFLKGERYCK